jgi:hypothetical protein
MSKNLFIDEANIVYILFIHNIVQEIFQLI